MGAPYRIAIKMLTVDKIRLCLDNVEHFKMDVTMDQRSVSDMEKLFTVAQMDISLQ